MALRQPHHKLLADLIRQDRITRRSGELRNLISQAERTSSLTEKVLDCLPIGLKDQFTVVGLEKQTLILSCTSAAIATQLRFQMDAIIRDVQARLGANQVTRIQIKIRPAQRNRKLKKAQRKLSEKNAQLLEEVAGQTKDENLRHALARLASHAR